MTPDRVWQVRPSLPGLLRSPGMRLFAGLAFSGTTLYLAIREIDLNTMAASLGRSDLRFVWLALVSVAVNTLAKAWRWQVLLGEQGKQVPHGTLLSALLVGQMVNTLYPIRLGELSRAYTIGGLGPGRSFTLGGILVEKLLDMCMYSLIAVLLILAAASERVTAGWGLNVPWDSAWSLGIVIATGGISLALLVTRPQTLIRYFRRIAVLVPSRQRSGLISRVENGAASLAILTNPREAAALVLWTLLIWITAGLNNVFILSAMRLQLPWIAGLLVLVFLQAGISLPSVPGKIGVFEYACMLALAPFQVSPVQAVGFGILLHAVVLLPTTLIGVILFLRQGLDLKAIRSLEPL